MGTSKKDCVKIGGSHGGGAGSIDLEVDRLWNVSRIIFETDFVLGTRKKSTLNRKP